jgi:hypothetical protein
MQTLGEEIFKLEQTARAYKEAFNELKIALGLTLNQIEEVYLHETFEGNPDFDEDDVTFNQFLASIYLNSRRTIQMKRNADYVIELGIDPKHYKDLDSSLIDLCRKHKKNPVDFINVSYSDAKRLVKGEEVW